MNMRRFTARGRRIQTSTSSGSVTLPNPSFYYDIEAANITKNGSNLIGQINDQSANAYHLTEGTDANKLLWVDNGSPNGAKDSARANSGDAAVHRCRKTTGVGALYTIAGWTAVIACKVTTAGSISGTLNFQQGNARGGAGFYFQSARQRTMETRTLAAGTFNSITYGTAAANTWEVHCVGMATASDDSAPTSTVFEVNNVAQSTSGTATFGIPVSPSIIIGTTNATGTPDTSVGLVALYPALLSPAQRALIVGQVMTAYGIT